MPTLCSNSISSRIIVPYRRRTPRVRMYVLFFLSLFSHSFCNSHHSNMREIVLQKVAYIRLRTSRSWEMQISHFGDVSTFPWWKHLDRERNRSLLNILDSKWNCHFFFPVQLFHYANFYLSLEKLFSTKYYELC